MTDSIKPISEDVHNPDAIEQPKKSTGPIYGIPGSEVLAWIKSWATDKRLPEPKERRIR